MALIIDPTEGRTVVIEFERKGVRHRSVRWSSDAELLETLMGGDNLDEIRRRYEEKGAVLLGISKIETNHIAVE